MKFELTQRREDRRVNHRSWSPPLRIDRLGQLLDVRLRASHDREHTTKQPMPPGSLDDAVTEHLIEHRTELAWGSRQEKTDHVIALDPQPRSRSARIEEHGGAFRHERLPSVDVRHLETARLEPRPYGGDHAGVFV